MAFWCRTNQSKLRHLTHQFKRYYIQVPSLNHSASVSKIFETKKKPFWEISVRKPTDFCIDVRFFAAPVQAQQRKDEKENSGPRLNDDISAQFVRLVLDDGHKVVSRHEALVYATRLHQDLVEVDRNANPPVCKIMDFHKVKYQKELKEKDQAKAKSDIALKKGNCKEVRFSGKIEQKDLQMKADSVKRLMEKGYRVKCMALPVSKKQENEDLGGYLSRLMDLIEDVSVLESGPHVEKKQAYAVIRHIKFGPSKKYGLKKLKAAGDTDGVRKTATPPTIDHSGVAMHREEPAEMRNEKNTAWSVSKSSDDLDGVFDDGEETIRATPSYVHAVPVPGFSSANAPRSTLQEPSIGTENRYSRREPMNQFTQKSFDNRGPGMRESFRSEPQFPNQRRQPSPPNMNAPPSMGEKKPIRPEVSSFRNSKLPNSMSKQEPPRPEVSSTQASGYGIFSYPTSNAPTGQGVAADNHRNKEGIPNGTAGVGPNQNIPGLKSDGSQSPGPDSGGQGKYGIFSR